MPVAVIAILVTFDKGKAWTLFMMGVAVILTGLTLIEALVKTSKNFKKRKCWQAEIRLTKNEVKGVLDMLHTFYLFCLIETTSFHYFKT